MADRVFLHIGLPKTGTTYLQQVMWENRARLLQDGVLLPGRERREHLWAALDIQGRKNLARRHPKAPGSWRRLQRELNAASGTGLVSHEFMCGATRRQAAETVAGLGEAEVHLVVTARSALGMLGAGWQEMVKNGSVRTLGEIPPETPKAGRGSEFSWRTWDLHGVLKRWGSCVPADRVHVLPMPGRDQPADQHWRNFASVLGLSPDGYVLPDRAANQSLGVVQIELLRRINAQLEGITAPVDRGRWIRGYLAESRLATQAGEPFGPGPDAVADCRERSRRAVELIGSAGYHVVGDVTALLVPDELPALQAPAGVSDAQLVDAASRLVADMLHDVRSLTRDSPEQ